MSVNQNDVPSALSGGGQRMKQWEGKQRQEINSFIDGRKEEGRKLQLLKKSRRASRS